jgi:hypothetical protein
MSNVNNIIVVEAGIFKRNKWDTVLLCKTASEPRKIIWHFHNLNKNFKDISQIWFQVFLQLKIMLICLQFPPAGLVFSCHFLPTFRKYVIQLISFMLMNLKSINPHLASSANLYNITRKTGPRVALHFPRINMEPEHLPNPIKINLETRLELGNIYISPFWISSAYP